MMRKYRQEYDIAPQITFGADHVALDIPDDGTQKGNEWEIIPVHKTQVSVSICLDSILAADPA